MPSSQDGTSTANAERAEGGRLELPAPGSAGPFPWRAYRRWHLGVLAGLLIYAALQSGMWTGDLGDRFLLGDDVAMCAWLQSTVPANLLRHPWHPFAGSIYYPRPDPPSACASSAPHGDAGASHSCSVWSRSSAPRG